MERREQRRADNGTIWENAALAAMCVVLLTATWVAQVEYRLAVLSNRINRGRCRLGEAISDYHPRKIFF